LLLAAGVVHDVAFSMGRAQHHKRSRDLILAARLPEYTAREQGIVAQLARYHRKAEPSERHKLYKDLPPEDRALVSRLAAILRLADGLDRPHQSAVEAVEARQTGPGEWELRVTGSGPLTYELWGARRKAGLFEKAFGVRLRIRPAPSDSP